jgi:hypothetical protein
MGTFDAAALPAVGDVWASRRSSYRKVEVTAVYDDGYVGVRRNTSRRRQEIKVETLLRDYRRVRSAAAPSSEGGAQ